jgi:hypothetical protein
MTLLLPLFFALNDILQVVGGFELSAQRRGNLKPQLELLAIEKDEVVFDRFLGLAFDFHRFYQYEEALSRSARARFLSVTWTFSARWRLVDVTTR